METVTGFETPEEAALELELPLLGTLPPPEIHDGPIAPAFPADERARREYHRAADRLLLSPHSRDGSIGLLGDVSSAHRALVASRLAASVAAECTAILVDADVRAAHLSFDDRDRAQEGLVDVLRYGVRSPRVVAPTQTPGLNLLPVGSGTVDLEGTFGSDAVRSLFEELGRTGDLLLINGPDLADFRVAASFLAEVGSWILVHEIGKSDAGKTRRLRDTFGRERCVGILAILPPEPEEVAGEVEGGAPEGLAEGAAAPPAASGDSLDIVHGAVDVAPRDEPAPPPPTEFAETVLLPTESADTIPPPDELAVEAAPVDAAAPDAASSAASSAYDSTAEFEALAAELGAEIVEHEPVDEPAAAEPVEIEPAEVGQIEIEPAEVGQIEAEQIEAEPVEQIEIERVEQVDPVAGEPIEPVEVEPVEPVAAVPEAGMPQAAPAAIAAPPEDPEETEGLEAGAEATADGGSRRPLWIGAVAIVVALAAFFFWRANRGEPGAEPPEARVVVAGEESASPDRGQAPDGNLGTAVPPAAEDPAPPRSAEVRSPVEVTPPVETAPPVERTAPVGTTGPRWAVHVGSHKSESNARREAGDYQRAGFPTVVIQKDIPGKGLWWRVYVGPYGEKSDATRTAAEMKQDGIADYTQVHRLPEE